MPTPKPEPNQPVLKQLRADHLGVDPQVQRSLDPNRVRKIADKLKRDALGTIIVSLRDDGTYHIVDGQHRAAAMKQCGLGDEMMDCKVFSGLSLSEEAELFRLYNDTRQMRPVIKFRVRVIEGDETAVLLHSILDDYGWKVTGASGNGFFLAVNALEKIYDGAGRWDGGQAAACDTLINVLTTAWGHNKDGVRAELVEGIGLVILQYGETLDFRKLCVELGRHDGGPVGVIGDARQLKKLRSCRVGDAMAEVVVSMVNKGRKTRKIPDWRLVAA
ncbi:DUF6551 family protein [Amycolatopsis dendrobii]|uniref:ParB N-terminal domain-containing protein n=1 Tax=Amycolatopsis dendrobii TaxID=2760662 RepID=A0A7W3VUI7_9PSEU|nr:DUF6551 family protein [Amycolatopsis dendrobii]MBB1153468.1 ParB N-terminal domain-containing protein [Amycolatopsis dendrobii]